MSSGTVCYVGVCRCISCRIWLRGCLLSIVRVIMLPSICHLSSQTVSILQHFLFSICKYNSHIHTLCICSLVFFPYITENEILVKVNKTNNTVQKHITNVPQARLYHKNLLTPDTSQSGLFFRYVPNTDQPFLRAAGYQRAVAAPDIHVNEHTAAARPGRVDLG